MLGSPVYSANKSNIREERMKKMITALLVFLMLFCLTACANMENKQASQEPVSGMSSGETKDRSNWIGSEKEKGEGSMNVRTFDFEKNSVLLNSGYEMPIMGMGTYSLDHDTCVNSVKAHLKNGGRLIDTAYMYGNEDAVGEGIRQAMEEFGIPREEIFVITKIYPSQFHDPEAAIDMALEKLDIGYIDMMLLHHPGTGDVKAYRTIRGREMSRLIWRWKSMSGKAR